MDPYRKRVGEPSPDVGASIECRARSEVVWAAYANAMRAAERAGRATGVRDRIRALVASETFGERFVSKILGREIGLV